MAWRSGGTNNDEMVNNLKRTYLFCGVRNEQCSDGFGDRDVCDRELELSVLSSC